VKTLIGFYYGLHHLAREMAKFGVVGAVAYVVDVGVFNLVLIGLHQNAVVAKIVSVLVATLVAYAGNRQWTFRHRHRSAPVRELALFFLLNSIGLGIAVACVSVSHYVLGFTSPVSDNIAANVVGLALGTTFRFWSYRRWVFTTTPAGEPRPRQVTPPR